MREIKFRGKSAIPIDILDDMGLSHDNGWMYGFYVDGFIVGDVEEATDEYIALGYWCRVYKDSVGQYTGLKDGNGQEIYEGDICRYSYISPLNGEKKTITWKVEYSPGVFWLRNIDGNKQDTLLWMKRESVEVIGNIYEDQELLGGDPDGNP